MTTETDAALRTAAQRVRAALTDDETYVLLPEGDERHFVGEAFLLGLGGVLVGGFLKGVNASLEKRAENWGKEAGNWLADRVENLLESKDPVTAAIDNDLAPALQAYRAHPASDTDTAVAGDILANALIVHGMTREAATAATAAAAAEGNRLLATR